MRANQRLPPLLPRPRRADRQPGAFALRRRPPIVLAPGADDRDFASARALRDRLERRFGLRLAIESHRRSADLGPRIELRREADTGEAYRIDVAPGRIEAAGAGAAGLRYAVETLAQLADARGRVPACRVEDAPDFARRGLMLDVSRGKVPTAATLREVVDLCVQLKLNVLMLYVEHTFRFRRHPEIGADASPLEAETLRALDAYAAERHVELVPNLQSLGHMEHVLKLPRYAPLAETERRWTLACADPASYELLEDLYDEYLPNFRSPLFHANCDEPWDLGRGRSRALSEQLGPGGLFLSHARRIHELARARGRRALIWADFVHAHPERIPELPTDLLLCEWWYEAEFDYDRVARFAEHGLEFWVCPGTSSWNCLFPRLDNALANIARWAEAGRRHGATGLLVTDWGDHGHSNLQGCSWLPVAWAAQQAWSGDEAPARFDRAFSRLRFDDASGEAARLQRELGRTHDAGFQVFNASPLSLLYFDEIDRAYFVRGVRTAPAQRTLRRLERVRQRLDAAAARFGSDVRTHAELLHAADASILGLRKALAARAWLAWRERPGSLDGRARRRLARELAALADAQRALGRTLRRLWLARSRPSNFELTGRRIERSIRSLRTAARALERNRPPPPPPPHEGFAPARVLAELRRALAAR
ncbi:MAG: glycoside hydrolase family 20 zincin-like fold domain-containing protein [Myxococcota bacterium]|nr:glycoside hydrolase family 20 zincin-like fold domain-containing protein [Myxococcota bacterium]